VVAGGGCTARAQVAGRGHRRGELAGERVGKRRGPRAEAWRVDIRKIAGGHALARHSAVHAAAEIGD
jgi:hypothetical protein